MDSRSTMTKDALAEIIEDLGYDVEAVRISRASITSDSSADEDNSDDQKDKLKSASVSINGMTCSHCTRTVASALQALPGVLVSTVDVDLGKRVATFTFKGDSINNDLIVRAIDDVGYDVIGLPRINKASIIPKEQVDQELQVIPDPGLRKVVMRIVGMTCTSCVTAVTDALVQGIPSLQPGSVRVDLESEMAMFISRNPEASQVRAVIEDRGYDVENIQIIHNLVPPAAIAEGPRRVRSPTIDSIVSLGSVTIDTPAIAVPRKVTLQITGMTCASCVRTIEQGLSAIAGVEEDSVKVNLLTGVGSFSIHGDVLDEKTISAAVSRLGYTASNISIIAEQQEPSPIELSAAFQVDMVISGMFCMNCVDKVRLALEQLPGTRPESISIGLDSGKVSFQYAGGSITRQRLRQTILQLGFMADSVEITKIIKPGENTENAANLVSTRLTVTGMTCSSCVANIERAMMRQPGVASCQVNLLAKSAHIQHDPSIVGARTLANMIEQLGYKAELAQANAADTLVDQRESMRATLNKEINELKRRFLWSLVFAIPIVIIDMIFMMGLPKTNPVAMAFMTPITAGLSINSLISFLLATPVQFWLGAPFYIKSYRSLRYARTANMETLVAMGTSVAYAASIGTIIASMIRHTHGETMNYFETSVLLITFIHFGKWLEALAKGKTAETITKLMDLQPDKAILAEISSSNGDDTQAEREIDAKDIQVGDILKVNAGARIPCDGKIWRGTTTTDESMITGESLPVAKKEGEEVITATINLTSTIYIRAIRVGADTTLSRIIQLVQDAQASPKAPIEHVADKISSVFVPIVIVLAFVTFIIWEVCSIYNLYPAEWVSTGGDKTTFSVMLGVSVLVIACPCGLGLASPTGILIHLIILAVMVGTGVAARYGVLVKGGGYALEMASRITTIAFDKTGTLTMGKPEVADKWIAPSPGALPDSVDDKDRINAIWKMLGRVTSSSSHPLSKAIEKRAREILAPKDGDGSDAVENDNVFEGVVVKNAKEIAGRGVMATMALAPHVSAQFWPAHHRVLMSQQERLVTVFLGNQEWMDENKARYANARQARSCQAQLLEWQNRGQSIVMLAVAPAGGSISEDDHTHTEGCNNDCACAVCRCNTGSLCCSSSRSMIVAQMAVADVLRPEARDVVAQLQKQGIEVWMITGDNERTGRVIADQLSIDKDCVLAGVKPEQKADKIRNLQMRQREVRKRRVKFWRQKDENYAHPVVAMVGDGINDSPSLAQADVGISVGSATDVAIEAASIVLIRNNLWDLLTMYDVSKAVVKRIRLNFLWAFIYNIVAIPIAAGILYPGTGHGLPPYIAGIAMVASSVSVVCSSLLLRFYKAPPQVVNPSN
ncbi:hypothetical protein BX666DRAFT_1855901 [Dichotomocladium elegans]|nr:hypothetical protein BX666DRAFT_1855901 [Dichotomocladium elegans]